MKHEMKNNFNRRTEGSFIAFFSIFKTFTRAKRMLHKFETEQNSMWIEL